MNTLDLALCFLKTPNSGDQDHHKHCCSLLGLTPPVPCRLHSTLRPAWDCVELTMEGRGCRREVPELTLVLFLGQKKASSTQPLQYQKNATSSQ